MEIDLHKALARAVAAAKAPGAVAFVGQAGETLFHEATGFQQLTPVQQPATIDTVYDLASLTKVIATTSAIMLLRDRGILDLDQPVSDFIPLPQFQVFTLRHLLTHTSGLPALKPLYRIVNSLDEMVQRISFIPLESPPGLRHQYSDLGFVLLGKVVELAARDSLDAFCRRNLFAPLGMTSTAYRPPAAWAGRFAATEQCAWRNRMIVGEVHDEHASAVGGVAGHAGLFSTAHDLALFCRALLDGKIVSATTLEEMSRLGQVPCYPWQGLGWQLDPWSGGAGGFLPTRHALGHTGWTGTCLWLDPKNDFFAILLSNNCHPSREHRDTSTLRRVFFRNLAAMRYPESANVHTGIDRVMWGNFQPLRRKRLALLTNSAATTQQGLPVTQALGLDPEVKLQRLFGPEHGLRGRAEAGQEVSDELDRVPIVSLYGDRKRPTREQLADIDLFAVDLPDVGARYYTYIATMKECLIACAEARVPVLVLDRPNPVGGVVLEGPVARVTGSPVCCAPIPIRHGMTLGETALFFRDTLLKEHGLDLTVVPVDNWPRDVLFGACSLPWNPPSPNIPTPETALVYIGTCLFEGTNLNEGRGTDAPFLTLGAPWLDPEKILARLDPRTHPGCTLEPLAYTPRVLPGKASSPRYKDETCRGIRIQVTDASSVRAFTLATALLHGIRRQHPERLQFEKSFDVLAGGPWLREQIEKGMPPLDLVASLSGELAAFDASRPKLYPSNEELLQNA